MAVKTFDPANTGDAIDVMSKTAAAFAVHEQTTPDMTVRVDTGRLLGDDGSINEVAAQNSATITAPSSDPRNDMIYVDPDDGTVGVVTGTEAATPVDPMVPLGMEPLAQVKLTTSTTSIANTDIDDCRQGGNQQGFFRRLPHVEKTSSFTINRGNAGDLVVANSASAITFTLKTASNLGPDFVVWVKNVGTGTLTIDTEEAGKTIDGNASITLAQNQATLICRDGSDFRSLELGDMAFNDTVGTEDIEDGAVTEDKLSFAAANDINIVVNAFRIADAGSFSVQNIVDGFVDGFVDQAGVDNGSSSGELFLAGAFQNFGVENAVEDTDLTDPSNHVTATAGVLVDDTDDNGATKLTSNVSGDFDFTFTLDTSGTIRWRLGMLDSSGTFDANGITNRGGLKQSSKDSFWINPDDDDVYFKDTVELSTATFSLGDRIRIKRSSGTFSLIQNGSEIHEWTNTSTADMQVIFWHANGGGTVDLVEVGDTVLVANMTLISDTVTAETQPDEAKIVILHEPVDTVTLNTDLKAFASRNGGTNWTQITLADEGVFDGSINVLTGDADISGQPAGTSMEYKIETLNNKEQRLHGTALQWR